MRGEGTVFFCDVIGEAMYHDLGKIERQGTSQEQRSHLINTTGIYVPRMVSPYMEFEVPALRYTLPVTGETAHSTRFLLLQCPKYLQKQLIISVASISFLPPPPAVSLNSRPVKTLLK